MEPGTQLGHYEILSSIGKGGMGEVWRARDTKLGREVAIKTLPPQLAGGDEAFGRFEREARLLASLNHPNIAAIYGLEEADGTRFLVLELVDGETLEDRLTRGPIPLEESLELAVQLVDALEAAHEREVIHRDLKPANIKITGEGKVKVLDFGLAKALAGDSPLSGSDMATLSIAATRQGMILGTPGYMSPEQARGERTDKRTDIWAFGCVLFEMLAGRQTFGGATMTDALAAVIARDPAWKTLPANIHPRIGLMLERCLEKNQKDRYHDIAEARVDIEHVLSDPGGIYASPVQHGAQGRSGLVPWMVAAAAGIVAIVALVSSFSGPEPARPVSRFAASSFPSLPVNNGGGSTLPLVAISPDGSQVAYPVVIGNELTIYVRDVDQFEGLPLRPEGFMAAPFYSPNGESIGFLDGAGAIRRATVDGSELPETIYAYPQGTFPVGASWGDDGHIVFALVDDGQGLLRIPERGGVVEALTRIDEEQDEEHIYPEVLPDGRGVLFTSGSDALGPLGSQIEVLDFSTGDRRVLIASGSQARYLEDGIIVYNDRGTLRAVGFDLDRLEIIGTPVPVLDDVEFYEQSRGAEFAVSRSGSLAYINRSGVQDTTVRTLAIVDPRGGRETLEIRTGAYMHPRVSPDGTEIAVETLGQDGRGIVWIYNRERNALRQLTQQGSNVRPIWTPDGERITFASNRDGTWGIWWQAADGSTVATRLTTPDEGMEHYPDSWSTDGAYLTYTNIDPENTSRQSIWIVNVREGSDPEPLVDPISGGAEFSLNGDWVAYRLNNQVYVEPFPPTGAIHQVTQDGGSYPVWSPNGARLLYRRIVSAQGAQISPLVTVDVTTEGRFTFGNERVLPVNGFLTFFGHRDYDFMPDGDSLVMVFPADLEETTGDRFVPRLHVVLNWVEELAGRVEAP